MGYSESTSSDVVRYTHERTCARTRIHTHYEHIEAIRFDYSLSRGRGRRREVAACSHPGDAMPENATQYSGCAGTLFDQWLRLNQTKVAWRQARAGCGSAVAEPRGEGDALPSAVACPAFTALAACARLGRSRCARSEGVGRRAGGARWRLVARPTSCPARAGSARFCHGPTPRAVRCEPCSCPPPGLHSHCTLTRTM